MDQPSDQHPSRFQLERWILESKSDAALMQHVNQCAPCHSIAENIRDENKAFLVRHPFSSFEARLEGRLKSRGTQAFLGYAWLIKAVPLGAMAVLALFVFRIYNPAPDIRYKGEVKFGYYLKMGDQAVEGPKSGLVRPGDSIRLYVQSQNETQVIVAGLEEDGKINFYYPDQAGVSVAIPTGKPHLFPDSIQLDASPHGELFLAIFSQDPLETSQIGETLRKKSEELKSQGKSLKDWHSTLLDYPNVFFYLNKATD